MDYLQIKPRVINKKKYDGDAEQYNESQPSTLAKQYDIQPSDDVLDATTHRHHSSSHKKRHSSRDSSASHGKISKEQHVIYEYEEPNIKGVGASLYNNVDVVTERSGAAISNNSIQLSTEDNDLERFYDEQEAKASGAGEPYVEDSNTIAGFIKRNKTIILGVIIVLIVVFVFYYFFYVLKKKDNKDCGDDKELASNTEDSNGEGDTDSRDADSTVKTKDNAVINKKQDKPQSSSKDIHTMIVEKSSETDLKKLLEESKKKRERNKQSGDDADQQNKKVIDPTKKEDKQQLVSQQNDKSNKDTGNKAKIEKNKIDKVLETYKSKYDSDDASGDIYDDIYNVDASSKDDKDSSDADEEDTDVDDDANDNTDDSRDSGDDIDKYESDDGIDKY